MTTGAVWCQNVWRADFLKKENLSGMFITTSLIILLQQLFINLHRPPCHSPIHHGGTYIILTEEYVQTHFQFHKRTRFNYILCKVKLRSAIYQHVLRVNLVGLRFCHVPSFFFISHHSFQNKPLSGGIFDTGSNMCKGVPTYVAVTEGWPVGGSRVIVSENGIYPNILQSNTIVTDAEPFEISLLSNPKTFWKWRAHPSHRLPMSVGRMSTPQFLTAPPPSSIKVCAHHRIKDNKTA